MAVKNFICSLILSLLLIIWTIPVGRSYSRVHLAGRGSPCAGIPQLQERTSWLPLCGVQREEAAMLCRQLGCGSVLHAPSMDGQREGSVPIGKKFVNCNGTNSTIVNCKVNRNLSGHCDPRAEVICSGHREVRLMDGDHPCAGRLEVRRGLEWGTICQSDLDLATAHVVCRELHCGAAVSTPGEAGFGHGPGPLWTQETFRCRGNESLLFHCPRGPARTEPCSHRQVAAIRCSGKTEEPLGKAGEDLNCSDSDNCTGGIQLKASPKTGLSAFPPAIQEILSSPWIASIILGTLLCLLLAYLVIQTRRTNIPNSVFLTGLANIQEDDYDDSGNVLVSSGELCSPLKQQGKHLEEET
ncbi:scavenger receptor cysteine-rich domain-containing protein SCART1-like isoform X2 [Tachyglossus aculeatus]|uniref:scavenger receptor cysteine-rich domain-containing protein SCART1-like isoform X2 n=1 Tax=Tachyglossus aculeatus TaxID=9261 RepID=UPI0018F3348D|nr:scavenger receptor cysteine-rich domain-containing protein SCART1-like isoform X2 [Tachyglossus aculeatus]